MFVTKPVERNEARRLRKEEGMAIKRIAARLEVSPSSVLYWTRDIKLTAEQRERNLSGPTGPQSPELIRRRTDAIRRTSRRRREASQQDGRRRARTGDLLHQAGCMLYWAEGAKSRNTVKICNSDPHMLVFFRRFLVESLFVDPSRLRLSLHVYLGNGLSVDEIEEHWLERLELPRSCLRKHAINPLPTSSSGMRKHKLPYGVATLTLHCTERVQHIFGAIQEYAGFDEPRWLDGPPRRREAGLERRPRPTACSSSETADLNSPPSSPASGSATGST